MEVDPAHPGAETVYKYAEPPDYKVKTSVGKPPRGYRDTGDTPKTTIQTIGGRVKRSVTVNMGVTTAHADPDSKEIKFTRNPNITSRAKKVAVVVANSQTGPVGKGKGVKLNVTDATTEVVESKSGFTTPVIRGKVGRGRDLGMGVVRQGRLQHIDITK